MEGCPDRRWRIGDPETTEELLFRLWQRDKRRRRPFPLVDMRMSHIDARRGERQYRLVHKHSSAFWASMRFLKNMKLTDLESSYHLDQESQRHRQGWERGRGLARLEQAQELRRWEAPCNDDNWQPEAEVEVELEAEVEVEVGPAEVGSGEAEAEVEAPAPTRPSSARTRSTSKRCPELGADVEVEVGLGEELEAEAAVPAPARPRSARTRPISRAWISSGVCNPSPPPLQNSVQPSSVRPGSAGLGYIRRRRHVPAPPTA